MKIKKINWRVWLPVILGLVYFLTRFINLTTIPIFVDEAIYTRWSQIILSDPSNNFFIPLSDGKQPLFMWIAAIFLKLIKDPLFATRSVSVLSGFLGVGATYLLAKEFFDKKIAFLASILFILCPFLLLYNRLAVVDGTMTTFFIFAVYFIYRLVKELNFKDSIWLGIFLGLGVLTKSTAALVIIFIPFSLVFLNFKNLRKDGLKLLGFWILSLGIAFLMYRILKLSPLYYLIAQRTPDFIFTPKEILSHPFDPFLPRIKDVTIWLEEYLTWPIFASSILGTVLLLKDKWRTGIFLGVYFLGPLFVEMEIAKAFTPRYFIFIAPFALIISAFFLNFLGDFIFKFAENKDVKNLGKILLIVVLLLPSIFFEFFLLTNPEVSPIPQEEKSGYLEQWSAGYGILEISQYLRQQVTSGQVQGEQIVVGTEGTQGYGTLPDGLEVYLRDVKNVSVIGVGQRADIYTVPENLIIDSKSQPAYLVVNNDRMYDKKNPSLHLIASYPKADGEDPLLFYQIKAPD